MTIHLTVDFNKTNSHFFIGCAPCLWLYKLCKQGVREKLKYKGRARGSTTIPQKPKASSFLFSSHKQPWIPLQL